MKSLIARTIGILLAFAVPAAAQTGQIASGTLWGNATAARAIASPVTASALLDRVQGSSQGRFLVRGGPGWVASATPTLGVTGTTAGTLSFAGSASGIVTVQPAAAAGTWSLTLPTSAGTSGYVLQTDGAGITSWVVQSGGGGGSGTVTSVTCGTGLSGGTFTTSGTCAISAPVSVANGGTGQTTLTNNGVLVGAGTSGISQLTVGVTGSVLMGATGADPAFSSTPTLGIAGTTAGTLALSGLTSGVVTIAVPAVASGTLTLPAATDTLVGKATTDTLTNKTYDTAGTGNVLRINGTAVSAVTGTGTVVLATTPTLITPILGVATGTTITLGANGGTGGSLVLNGSTSGSGTVRVAAVAGTATIFQLPASNGSIGQFLKTDGAGITSWDTVSGSGTVNSGTTGQVGYYASTTDAITGNTNMNINGGALTLGAAGGVVGQLKVAGSTSGTVTITPAAIAGTWTLTLPAVAGTNGHVLTTDGSGVTSWAAAPNGAVPTGGGTGQVLAKIDATNFNTTWATVAGTGTVTSIDVSGGSTGLTTSGGPVTTSGTITLAGTLIVANGGTGRTSLTNHGVLVGAGTSAVTQLAAAAAGTVLSGAGASSDPAFTSTPTLGVAGTTLGTLAFAGNTSGTVTVQSAAAAGTWTLTLPTSAGTNTQVLQTNGSGVTAWASAGTGTVTSVTCGTGLSGGTISTTGTCSITAPVTVALGGTGATSLTSHSILLGNGTSAVTPLAVGAAGTVLTGVAASDPAFSATPTLGVVGATLGSLTMAGNTSGSVKLTPQAAAGTTTILTLGNTSGTVAAVATAPLAISSTTGTISITGAAGQVLAGSGPAFTATPTLGAAAGTTGKLSFAGTTSGVVDVTVAAAAGSWTMTLPTTAGTSGYLLQTNGSGVTTWAATGTGDVTGPSSSVKGGTAVFSSTTGKVLVDGGAVNLKGYGARGDSQQASLVVTIGSSSATLNVAVGNFVTADIGKTIVIPGAGGGGNPLVTTIAGVASTIQITLTVPASTALTSQSKLITWGTNDSSAFTACLVTDKKLCYAPSGVYLVAGGYVMPTYGRGGGLIGDGDTPALTGFVENGAYLHIQSGGTAIVSYSATNNTITWGNHSSGNILANLNLSRAYQATAGAGLRTSTPTTTTVNVTTTAGGSGVTVGASTFALTDVGKSIRIPDAGTGGAVYIGSIATYINPLNITVSPVTPTALTASSKLIAMNIVVAMSLIENVSSEYNYYGFDLGETDFSFINNTRASFSTNVGYYLHGVIGGGGQWQFNNSLSLQNGSHGYLFHADLSTTSLGEHRNLSGYANAGYGIVYLGTSSAIALQAVRLSGGLTGNDTLSGILLDTYGDAHSVSDYYAEAEGNYGFAATANNTNVIFNNVRASQNALSGILVTATNWQINGGSFLSNGLAATASDTYGIYATGGYGTVTGARAGQAGGTSQTHGIASSAGATQVGWCNNNFRGNATASTSFNGATTVTACGNF